MIGRVHHPQIFILHLQIVDLGALKTFPLMRVLLILKTTATELRNLRAALLRERQLWGIQTRHKEATVASLIINIMGKAQLAAQFVDQRNKIRNTVLPHNPTPGMPLSPPLKAAK
jgi:hypothetical protein